MSEPYIRRALPADEEELGRLDRATWSPLHAVMPEPQPPYGPFFDERNSPEDHLVAVLDGRVVGYVRLAFPTPLAANAHVRQIQGLAVAEEARGRGVGRALIRAVTEEARRRAPAASPSASWATTPRLASSTNPRASSSKGCCRRSS